MYPGAFSSEMLLSSDQTFSIIASLFYCESINIFRRQVKMNCTDKRVVKQKFTPAYSKLTFSYCISDIRK